MAWDADKGTSHAMRSKEEAHDYRYFPDPDLPPLVVSTARIERIRRELPELPDACRSRLVTQYGLPDVDAALITAERPRVAYFEAAAAAGADGKKVANWMQGEIPDVAAERLAELIRLIDDGTISGKIAKDVFQKMKGSGRAAADIVAAEGLVQVTDSAAIEEVARKIVADNPKQAEQYRAGNPKMLGYFVGQVMKATQGKANPQVVNDVLKRLLG
jgi:aspartyl-tRNA(Asn)/glutamyl-tRNA(Gln) amidotransferase subunit B